MDGKAERLQARLAGLFLLLALAVGSFADSVVRSALVVPENGRETARNIADYPGLYRSGLLADMAGLIAMLVAIALLYALLRRGGPMPALIALLIGMTGLAMEGANLMPAMIPVELLNGAPHPGMSMAQIQTWVRISLALHADLHHVALLFLGIQALLIGWIALRGRGLWIGWPMLLAGIAQALGRGLALAAPPLWDQVAGQLSLVPLLCTAGFAAGLILLSLRSPEPVVSS